MVKPTMCEQCEGLRRHPHAASDIARFKELGVTEQTRASGGRILRKRYQCTLCHAVWTQTKELNGPGELWTADR